MKRKLDMILVLALFAALICAGSALALDKSGYNEHLREFLNAGSTRTFAATTTDITITATGMRFIFREIEPHYGGENNVTCTWKGACELC